ncbi:alpha/beta hydrolase [Microbacterium sp. ISL-59]|uniref:alpha/beta fold hydrolase n=1 Tax=Microbacterium sp. ISL-59 TaxID=2819159 RepID=UPI001BE6B235|nr:alpha/beta hydrolase [Microbacterium sp. ISL-59]MBT2494038.1 alpha/beta hydrolase [Microbacterium sp. ISL-59]
MKKPVKRVLIALTSVVAVIAVGLVATTVGNAVATAVEQDRIEPYGQKVTVDGHEMNVMITGEGSEDIVLLPGFGTASPVLDFEPLVTELAKDHRVIVVEPFGYGLSDGTDRARTTDNIVTETHSALQELGVDDYVLMGHSIAGIYGIQFANRYPDEVRAFVGIDSSVPGQPGSDTELPVGLFGAAKNLGLVRLIASFRGTGYDESVYSADVQEQIAMLTNRNTLSPTYLNAMSLLHANFDDALGTSFPEDLPLLLFVVADNPTVPTWADLHEEQAAAVDDGTVVPLDGTHYLHHTHTPEIVDGFRSWERTRIPAAE